jgi:hypothetical protein
MFYKLKTNTRECRKTALEYIYKMQREGWREGWMEGTMHTCRYGLTAEVGRLYASYLLFSHSKIHFFHPEIFILGLKFAKILL